MTSIIDNRIEYEKLVNKEKGNIENELKNLNKNTKEEKLLYLKIEKDRYNALKESKNISGLSSTISVFALISSVILNLIGSDSSSKIFWFVCVGIFVASVYALIISSGRNIEEYLIHISALEIIELEIEAEEQKDELSDSIKEFGRSLESILSNIDYLRGQMDSILKLRNIK